MKESINLTGHILLAHPKSEDPYFNKSVVLIAKHGTGGTWGIVVNKHTTNLTLGTIMQSVGIDSTNRDKIYIGGPVDTNRVFVIHSMDWASSGTMKINSDIGVTNEIAVLAAIAEGCGPALYRTSIGTCGWGPGQLDGEIRGESPWKLQNRWLNAPATIESIFNLNGEEQWQQGIEIVAQNKINSWL